MPLDDFLQKFFSAERYAELRKSVCRFAEGFDLAEADKASVLELREEWMEEDEQYRLKTGFDEWVNAWRDELQASSVKIHYNAAAGIFAG